MMQSASMPVTVSHILVMQMRYNESNLVGLLDGAFSQFFTDPKTVTQIKDLLAQFVMYMVLCDDKITVLINHIKMMVKYWPDNKDMFGLSRDIKHSSRFILE